MVCLQRTNGTPVDSVFSGQINSIIESYILSALLIVHVLQRLQCTVPGTCNSDQTLLY